MSMNQPTHHPAAGPNLLYTENESKTRGKHNGQGPGTLHHGNHPWSGTTRPPAARTPCTHAQLHGGHGWRAASRGGRAAGVRGPLYWCAKSVGPIWTALCSVRPQCVTEPTLQAAPQKICSILRTVWGGCRALAATRFYLLASRSRIKIIFLPKKKIFLRLTSGSGGNTVEKGLASVCRPPCGTRSGRRRAPCPG